MTTNIDEYGLKNDLKELFRNISLELSQKEIGHFQDYTAELLKWNKKFNLTAITDLSEIAEKHYYDSLLLVKMIDLNKVNTIVDIGTGAGFPGIPLKICFPHLEVLLVDTTAKRISFLNHIREKLNFDKVNTLHSRVEDMGKNTDYREQYDLVVSRAVAPLSVLLEYTMPLLTIGGSVVAYKGPEVDEELTKSQQALSILGGEVDIIDRQKLPVSGNNRVLVKIVKRSPTPAKYPRKAGIPVKRPL